jgi:Fur family ferric uptake transcriptional regulator
MAGDPHQVLKEYLLRHGLKASRQREIIADVFFRAGGHLRVDELLQQVRKIDPKVSQATVYRTMKLLTDCGLAAARNFLDGQTRYERSDRTGEHHDHLICTGCGKIVEFVDERIEELQERVANGKGFLVTHHKMELYGLCESCRESGSGGS